VSQRDDRRPDAGTPDGPGPLDPGFDRRWCADEVDIDFPSIPAAVDRIRAGFVDDEAEPPLRAEIRLSPQEAIDGVSVPLDVPVRDSCGSCGGRGESWMEWCRACAGTGEALARHRVHVSVPAGVSHGARLRFSVASALAVPTRVEVFVTVGVRR
jgi:hypothetical protein